MTDLSFNSRVGIILGVGLLAVAGLLIAPPIPQDLNYHNLVDKRSFLGILNFADVVSSLMFLIVGLVGLRFLQTRWNDALFFIEPSEKWIWLVLFGGIGLVSVGSGYYHLKPDNATLVWDRLPMTLAFMSLFSIIVAERINYQAGLYLLPVLLLAGVGSVFYWDYTEQQGMGDLRPYALVQFFPMLAVPLMCTLFPAKYTGLRFLIHALGWYVLAKVFEYFDRGIFDLLQGMVSGHTLKHLAAGMASYALFKYFKYRQKIPGQG